MKIHFIASSRIPTERAMGTAILKQCEAFAKAGNEVTLVVPRRSNERTEDPFLYHSVARLFTIIYLPSCDISVLGTRAIRYWIQRLTFYMAVQWYVRKQKNSLLYSREPELIGPLITKNIKVIELHHLYGLRHFGKFFLRRCTSYVTISHALREDLVTRFSLQKKNILVAPSGVDLRAFVQTPTKKAVRDRFNLNSTHPFVLYIGALEAGKGYETFLKASTHLKGQAQCLVVGGSEAQVVALKTRYPDVIFLGTQPQRDLPAIQQIADVLVVPNSAQEVVSARYTSPLKLLAHMASGIPIVASRVSAITELLDEQMATLVAPDDAMALAEGIRSTLTQYENACTKAQVAKLAVATYDWGERTRRILNFIATQDNYKSSN